MNQMLSISCRVTQLNSLEAGGGREAKHRWLGFLMMVVGGRRGGNGS